MSSPLPELAVPAGPAAILREVFGYARFRGQQAAIVDHVTAGGDALVLMPTGGGKSLCYQIPAIARQQAGRGVTLVISPLIALMHDQVGALHEAGVAAVLNRRHDTGRKPRRSLVGAHLHGRPDAPGAGDGALVRRPCRP